MNADQVRTLPAADTRVEQEAAQRRSLAAAEAVADVLAELGEPGFSARASGEFIPLGLALLRRFCVVGSLQAVLRKQASSWSILV